MRLLTYRNGSGPHLGALLGEHVVDLPALCQEQCGEPVPDSLLAFITAGNAALALAHHALQSIGNGPRRNVSAHALCEVHVLAPLDPPRGNIVAIGRNFQAHAEESARARQEEVTPPTVFTKAQTAITGPYDDVPLHANVTQQLDWEAELGVVIGRKVLNVSVDHALDYVFGYIVLNDVSARDLQFGWGGQFFKGKSLDGSCPIGPWIVTADEVPDPQKLRVVMRLNGEIKQNAHTSDMIHTVAELIAKLSAGMTLLPGTLIATGTPAGVGMGHTPPQYLKDGDVMETEIEGIGMMRNRVSA
ncbi:MAG: fumarylacetoacetate hydrolase family protein [Chloroflexota bacterium]